MFRRNDLSPDEMRFIELDRRHYGDLCDEVHNLDNAESITNHFNKGNVSREWFDLLDFIERNRTMIENRRDGLKANYFI